MAREFFKNLPNTTTPLTAPRINALLDGDEPMGNIVVDSIKSKNILQNMATTQTINGITYTINNDASITANGRATSTSILFIKEYPFEIEAGQYMLSGCPSGGSSSTYKLDILNASGDPLAYDYGSGTSVNLQSNLTSRGVRIVIYSGVTVNNIIFKPMIEKGTTATLYAPYQDLTNKPIYNNSSLLENSSIITAITPLVGSNYSGYGNSYYYKIGTRVHIHLGLQGLTANTLQQVFNIPTGYRPNGHTVSIGQGGGSDLIGQAIIESDKHTLNVKSPTAYISADFEYDAFS